MRITMAPIVGQPPVPKVIGVYDAFRNDTVYLQAAGSTASQYYSTRNIMTVERSAGLHHPYVKSAFNGALLGAAIGFVWGKLLRYDRCYEVEGGATCQPPDPAKAAYEKALPVGTVLGLLGGVYVGSRMSSQIWVRVPFTDLR